MRSKGVIPESENINSHSPQEVFTLNTISMFNNAFKIQLSDESGVEYQYILYTQKKEVKRKRINIEQKFHLDGKLENLIT